VHLVEGERSVLYQAISRPVVFQPELFTSGAVLAPKTIVFSRTDSHFARPILFHPIGEAADITENADSALKSRPFRC